MDLTVPTHPVRVLTSVLLVALLCIPTWSPAQGTSHPSEDTARIRHLLNRISYGPAPGDIDRVQSMGIDAYLQQQLNPAQVPENPRLSKELNQLSTLKMTPVELFQTYQQPLKQIDKKKDPAAAKEFRRKSRLIVQEASQARLLRALDSERQLQEVMVEFWFNHFNVYAGKGLDRIWIGSYEEHAIRPHAMGRFRDLLGATAHHPAMLFYLDNWLNSAPGTGKANSRFKGLNENYARELLELHTLGVDGGYTQDDVVELARVLTGWGIPTQNLLRRGFTQTDMMTMTRVFTGFGTPGPDMGEMGQTSQRRSRLIDRLRTLQSVKATGFFFDQARHDYGTKTLLGHQIAGSGEPEVEEALDLLARHPATAKHIAYKLAQYFVADEPPPSLVNRLTATYLKTDGQIRPILDTLFHSPEFWDPAHYQGKFKSPYRYLLSSLRASDVEVSNTWMVAGLLKQMGMPLYGCETPNGYKNTQEAWLSPDALTSRLNFAVALSGGYLPLNRTGGQSSFQLKELASQLTQTKGQQRRNQGNKRRGKPVALDTVLGSLHYPVDSKTQATLAKTPQAMKASIILGHPDFMTY